MTIEETTVEKDDQNYEGRGLGPWMHVQRQGRKKYGKIDELGKNGNDSCDYGNVTHGLGYKESSRFDVSNELIVQEDYGNLNGERSVSREGNRYNISIVEGNRKSHNRGNEKGNIRRNWRRVEKKTLAKKSDTVEQPQSLT